MGLHHCRGAAWAGTSAPGGTWAAVEPVRSAGSSAMWGWVEPVSEVRVAADGRTCRDMRQVAVHKAGTRHAEMVRHSIR
ncbi:hypothetical protein [Magnetospirillum sp. UT-4]|uniref:hypothetical protein n=1 Tax=Magnetospirillum sp. UT-4 TaxID=2681467 RepID=UPI0013813290|nr:hypothetical protein [Magnetospirillum sp. UT-4]CAA7619569.1 exported hypothetical protein [Magnetospirillum sp. UT-4]